MPCPVRCDCLFPSVPLYGRCLILNLGLYAVAVCLQRPCEQVPAGFLGGQPQAGDSMRSLPVALVCTWEYGELLEAEGVQDCQTPATCQKMDGLVGWRAWWARRKDVRPLAQPG